MRYTTPVFTMVLLVTLPGSSTAQECPPPRGSLELAKTTMTRLGSRQDVQSTLSLSGPVRAIIAPPPCPWLPADQDAAAVVDELVRFVALEAAPRVAGQFFRDLRMGFESERRRPDLRIPLDAVAFAVERGSHPITRGAALDALMRLAEDQEVRRYLLGWARAERGPPAFPDLPERIVLGGYGIPGVSPAIAGAAGFNAELRADVSLIRNPRARCFVERGGPTMPHDWTDRRPPC